VHNILGLHVIAKQSIGPISDLELD